MSVIGIDIGGTKIATAIINGHGKIINKNVIPIEDRSGSDVARLIKEQIEQLLKASHKNKARIAGVGISVPGIYYAADGCVWAPNIRGWTNYPLLSEMQAISLLEGINIKIDSDRACYILGETWQGTAKGCKNAIFIAVGTGIGAGILIEGEILRGQGDVAGAIGWLALDRPYRDEYNSCGCFEYQASGMGLARAAKDYLKHFPEYDGPIKQIPAEQITSYDIFGAYQENDPIAVKVIENAIQLWGMTAANLVSLFNPEIIVFGGGIFGPAAKFIRLIKTEAQKWAQPISIKQVKIKASVLGGDAGLFGAARLAMII